MTKRRGEAIITPPPPENGGIIYIHFEFEIIWPCMKKIIKNYKGCLENRHETQTFHFRTNVLINTVRQSYVKTSDFLKQKCAKCNDRPILQSQPK